MTLRNDYSNFEYYQALSPVNCRDNKIINGEEIDTNGFKSLLFRLEMDTSDFYNSVVLEHKDNESDYNLVSEDDISISHLNSDKVQIDYVGNKRFVRMSIDCNSITDPNSSYIGAIAILEKN
jgi:hypothetical protein